MQLSNMKNYSHKRSCNIVQKMHTEGNECSVTNKLNMQAGRSMLNRRVNTENQSQTVKIGRRYILKKNLKNSNKNQQRFTFFKENINSFKCNQLVNRASYNQYGYKNCMNISQKLRKYRIRQEQNTIINKDTQNTNRQQPKKQKYINDPRNKNIVADIRTCGYTTKTTVKNEEQAIVGSNRISNKQQNIVNRLGQSSENSDRNHEIARRIRQQILNQSHKQRVDKKWKPIAANMVKVGRTQSLQSQVDEQKSMHQRILKSRKNLKEEDFKMEKLIGAGTFGKVYSATFKDTNTKVAIKKVFNDKNYKNRQIELMRIVNSPFVIKQLADFTTQELDEADSAADSSPKQYYHFVMPNFKCNLYQFLQDKHRDTRLTSLDTKVILYQMFRGLLYLHSRGICHRDLKPQNILINQHNNLVVCDLGSAKILNKGEPNISYICSRCYRAPQLIFGTTQYTISIDIWSAGCIVLQILNSRPLFIGKDSLQHLIEIIKVMGTPSRQQILFMNPQYDIKNFTVPKVPKKQWNQIFPRIDINLVSLLNNILVYSPIHRLNAGQILSHNYFNQIREQNNFKQLSQVTDTSNFFIFDHYEMKLAKNSDKLIPKWYKNRTIN